MTFVLGQPRQDNDQAMLGIDFLMDRQLKLY